MEEIVKLASQPLPERPDGIVAVAKYTSATMDSCRSTEAEYERLARDNPASIFLRCFAEYDNADILIGKANIQNWPTFDLFYGGSRVARVEGNSLTELEELPSPRHEVDSSIDMNSVIDVTFVMLIFFILAATYATVVQKVIPLASVVSVILPSM